MSSQVARPSNPEAVMSESSTTAALLDLDDRSGPERREMIGGSCRRAPVDHEANEHRAETHRRLALLAVERLAGAFLRPSAARVRAFPLPLGLRRPALGRER